MNLRALVALAALAVSGLATMPAAASPTLACEPGPEGFLSCWGGKLTLALADVPGASLVAASPGRDVVVAYNRACALSPSGSLDCWGDNNYGELGDGTLVHRDKPVRVRDLDDVTMVALGPHQSCALRRSGKVACWGYDDATNAHRVRPMAVPSLDRAVEVVAGGGHACARRQDGSVWCWGWNHYGQLGDGTLKDRRRPIRVGGLSDVVELSAGDTHTCARRQDGSVWCWGNGWGGEDGAEDELLVPTPVRAIRGATALVSTGSGLLALQNDGRLVSCRYHVGEAESEASAKLVCRHEKALGASLLEGVSTAIHRP